MIKLPQRTKKPRATGLTSLHDVNTTIGELRNILEDFADFIDIAKLGVGTGLVMPRLQEKIDLYRAFDIQVYFGGTLFEKFYYLGELDAYKEFMIDHGISWVEISCGTLDISLDERIALVEKFKDDFTVLSEVGSKDAEKIMPPSEWIKELADLLAAGSSYVITEGRQSGTAGIYRANGEIRTGLVADIFKSVGSDRLIFEAPTSMSQNFFINQIGANVNLGNISPNEVLLLETQRLGLRRETFYLE